MNDPAGDPRGARHNLSDWLALHELDPISCRHLLDAMTLEHEGRSATPRKLDLAYQAMGIEEAWLSAAEAMRDLLSAQQSFVADTFDHTDRIVVDQRGKSRKALTLDNGPKAYPTIVHTYRGEPSDCLVIAHEFAHALQIRASGGKFVAPIMREVCAFLGESALVSHTRHSNPAQHTRLAEVWRADNERYFGRQRDRLRAALTQPGAPYKYSWNYPIARYLAILISESYPQDQIWIVFEGRRTVRGVLRELNLSSA